MTRNAKKSKDKIEMSFPFLDSYKLKNELIIRNRKTGTRDRNEKEKIMCAVG